MSYSIVIIIQASWEFSRLAFFVVAIAGTGATKGTLGARGRFSLSIQKDMTFLSFSLKAIPANQATAESQKEQWIGKKLAPFTLLNQEGQEVTEAIGRGKVMLINTWFTSSTMRALEPIERLRPFSAVQIQWLS